MDFVEQLSILLESSWAFGRPSAVHESGGLDYRLWAQLGCQSAWLRTNSQGFGKETKRWSGCDWWFYHTVPYFSIFFIVRLLEILYMTYTRSCVWCLYMVILCVFMQSCLWIYFCIYVFQNALLPTYNCLHSSRKGLVPLLGRLRKRVVGVAGKAHKFLLAGPHMCHISYLSPEAPRSKFVWETGPSIIFRVYCRRFSVELPYTQPKS